MVLNRTIPTAVADAGASSNCGAAPLVSTCGNFEIKEDPFSPTGKQSDKTFRDASGGLSPATELKELPMKLRPPANLIHMVPGFKDNLLSTGKFVDAGYAWIFDQDEVCVYDTRNTTIATSRAAIMKGWRVPEEGVWRFPLLPTANAPTFDSKRSPQEILRAQPPPLPKKILNVYEIKTKPELTRYCTTMPPRVSPRNGHGSPPSKMDTTNRGLA